MVTREDLSLDPQAFAAYRARATAEAAPPPTTLSIAETRAYIEGNSATGLVFRLAERAAALSDHNSVVAMNGDALDIASAQDHTDHLITPLLWRVPILLKDNIETRDMPTTAGSLALARNGPGRDAPLVTRLRERGDHPRQGQPVRVGQYPVEQFDQRLERRRRTDAQSL